MMPFPQLFGRKIFITTSLCLLMAPSILLASQLKHGGIVHASEYSVQPTPLTEWILDTTVGNVDCYHQVTDCNGKKVVFLKFNNKNNYKVTITWKEVFVTKQVPQKQDGAFGQKQLVITPGETSQTDCTDIKQK